MPEDLSLIESMAARLSELEAEMAAMRRSEPSRQQGGELAVSASRRDILRRSALVAGAAVATVATVGVKPAQASDGDSLVMGDLVLANTATGMYSETVSGSKNVLTVSADDTGYTGSGFPAAIGAYAYSGGQRNGVYGYTFHDDLRDNYAEGYPLIGYAEGKGVQSRANLYLNPGGSSPQSDEITHFAGEVRVDRDGTFWICTANGTPGDWLNLNLAVSQADASTQALVPTFLRPPERAYDTRVISDPTGDGPAPKGKLAKKVVRKIDLSDATSLPSSARTVVVTVTVRNGAGPGVLSLYEAGISRPPFGVVAWTEADQVVNAQVVIGCDDVQKVKAYTTEVCDVSIDISGYYTSAEDAPAIAMAFPRAATQDETAPSEPLMINGEPG